MHLVWPDVGIKSSTISLYLKSDSFQSSPKSCLIFNATFVGKFVAKNFQKSPNLVTLVTMQRMSGSISKWIVIKAFDTLSKQPCILESFGELVRALAYSLHYATITKHYNFKLIDRLQFPWLTAYNYKTRQMFENLCRLWGGFGIN